MAMDALFAVVDCELRLQALDRGADTRCSLTTPVAPLQAARRKRSSSGALDGGTTCASEMSDQEHFAALHTHEAGDDQISGMPAFPYFDDTFEQYPQGFFQPTGNDAAASGQLPLFQAQWGVQAQEEQKVTALRPAKKAAAAKKPGQAAPIKISKRAAATAAADDEGGSRKNPRLSGEVLGAGRVGGEQGGWLRVQAVHMSRRADPRAPQQASRRA